MMLAEIDASISASIFFVRNSTSSANVSSVDAERPYKDRAAEAYLKLSTFVDEWRKTSPGQEMQTGSRIILILLSILIWVTGVRTAGSGTSLCSLRILLLILI